ncbi:Thiamine repressible genes regulatory protein thi1 [Talaromyces islandicus]|uniref:Thiamine repressible genes regulatory protein thi1 n=1 Tax=Talaromyces islandicus TaxID=28573 RepID=A0A0U1M5P8_TALIS|nr:Thiamine repressible genes regulatory protein thi1 [Talaromyces islandicus]
MVTLPPGLSTQQARPADNLKALSCSSVECIYPEPVRSRHQRKPELILTTRLKHYESLLRKNGINPNTIIDSDDYYDSVSVEDEAEKTLSSDPSDANNEATEGQFLSRGSKSIYFDNNVWRNFGRDLRDTDSIFDDMEDYGMAHNLSAEQLELPLNFDRLLLAGPSTHSLASLHPDPVQSLKLWNVFLENVNPLTKVIHAPSVQKQIMEVIGDIESVGKGFEALLFAVYCCALNSMTEDEVKSELYTEKAILWNKCRVGAQEALVNARFTSTTDFLVLQALLLFIISAREDCHQRSLWCLSGVTIRIAHQLGLHRDGSCLGMPFFEAEMRRRIWWQLTVTDRLIARVCGSLPTPLPQSDTRLPTIINDAELHPDMKESVADSSGATEMIFCQVRYEFNAWFQRQDNGKVAKNGEDPWRLLAAFGQKMSENAVADLERTLIERIIKKCDPSIPLHLLAITSARSTIAMVRLMALDPFHSLGRGKPLSQAKRDKIFESSLELAKFSTEIRSMDLLKRFSWHLDYFFPWPALLYALSELRYRPIGESTSQAWSYLSSLYSRHHARLLYRPRGPLHIIISKLAVKAWAVQKSQYEQQGLPVPSQPGIVAIASEIDNQGYRFATKKYDQKNYREKTPIVRDFNLSEPTHGINTSTQLNEDSSDFLADFFDQTAPLDNTAMDWGILDRILTQNPQDFDTSVYL